MSLFGGLTNVLPVGGEGGGLGGLLGGSGFGGLLGGNGNTLVDTGEILGEADGANNSPTVDLDLISSPRETPESGAVDIGILPQMDGQSLLDADLLSGSYGANYLLTADVGPDGFGPVLTGSLLGDPGNPVDLQLLGTPVTDLLGGDTLGDLL